MRIKYLCKKTVFFYYVAALCTTTGGTERDAGAAVGQGTLKELKAMEIKKDKKFVIKCCMFVYFHQQCRPQK